jgi:hypothetical protein
MNAKLSEIDIEQFLRDTFEDNYRTLRLEGGHGLTPDIKDYAYQQVLRYWQKLKEVAENVTDTEVPLVLPNQQTPKRPAEVLPDVRKAVNSAVSGLTVVQLRRRWGLATI